MAALPQRQASPKAGIVLLNFGGPRSLAEVPRFLFEILRDPNTIQIPAPGFVQDLLAWRIATRRSAEVARQYGEIGGASPIVASTERLAEALGAALSARGIVAPIFIAHRYLPGHARATVAQMHVQGIERIVALPLYPHFSWATTGSSAEQLLAELARVGHEGSAVGVRSYPDAEGYVDAVVAGLRATLAALREQLGRERTERDGSAPAQIARTPGSDPGHAPTSDGVLVLCSAHGLPASYVTRGDPYRLELYRTVDALRRRFPDERFVLSFQSRVGPAQWLKPYTDRILADLAAAGVRHLVFLPIAFVNDHLETLHEIGHTYFAAARAVGMTPHRVPAIEAHPAYVALLADRAAAALADGPVGSGGVVPLAELLPPSQAGRRVGWWLWSLWLAGFVAALAHALAR
jgi:protoporphyrin/coproporphyrin ferrochelatase